MAEYGSWQTERPIKVAFFDADGTLLSFVTHEVPASARDALVELRRGGVACVLCTGRSPSILTDIPLELFDACVTMSGQYCFAGENVYLSRSIDPSDMAVVVEQVRAGLYNCLFMEPDRSFLSGHDELVDRAFADANLDVAVEDVGQALERPIYQLNLFLPSEGIHVAEQATRTLKFTRWSRNFADVMPADGGKDAGVRATLELFGATPEEAVAFGDGGNDLDMFRAVGTSVAMGSASADVQEQTTFVTEDAEHDGIWNACVRLGLISE